MHMYQYPINIQYQCLNWLISFYRLTQSRCEAAARELEQAMAEIQVNQDSGGAGDLRFLGMMGYMYHLPGSFFNEMLHQVKTCEDSSEVKKELGKKKRLEGNECERNTWITQT